MTKKAKSGGTARAALAPAANPAPTKMSREQAAQERRWRAEDALRTLSRADEIKRDAGLMRDVRGMANEQMKALQKVAGNGNGGKK